MAGRKTKQPAANQVRLVRINNRLLAELLSFPPGSVIDSYAADLTFGQLEPTLVLKVRSADFSPIDAGLQIPFVDPKYRSKIGGVEFVSWS